MSKRRCGKGKGYRTGSPLRIAVNEKLEEKALIVATNLANGCNAKVVRIAPNSLGYKTVRNNGKDKALRGSVAYQRIKQEGGSGVGGGYRGKAGKLPDGMFYNDRLDVTGGGRAQCMVRTGTTPGHKLLIDKDGDKILITVSEKPKYSVVGLQSSKPKDGGK